MIGCFLPYRLLSWHTLWACTLVVILLYRQLSFMSSSMSYWWAFLSMHPGCHPAVHADNSTVGEQSMPYVVILLYRQLYFMSSVLWALSMHPGCHPVVQTTPLCVIFCLVVHSEHAPRLSSCRTDNSTVCHLLSCHTRWACIQVVILPYRQLHSVFSALSYTVIMHSGCHPVAQTTPLCVLLCLVIHGEHAPRLSSCHTDNSTVSSVLSCTVSMHPGCMPSWRQVVVRTTPQRMSWQSYKCLPSPPQLFWVVQCGVFSVHTCAAAPYVVHAAQTRGLSFCGLLHAMFKIQVEYLPKKKICRICT